MSVIFLLIPLSLVLAGGFLAAFIWAVRAGQYDDTCTPPMRLLTEDVSPARISRSKADQLPCSSDRDPAARAGVPDPFAATGVPASARVPAMAAVSTLDLGQIPGAPPQPSLQKKSKHAQS